MSRTHFENIASGLPPQNVAYYLVDSIVEACADGGVTKMRAADRVVVTVAVCRVL
ncbi:hypothetical protein [Mycobacterium yunnanensis]|uniref:hypothetical protein n=1 Tax=Mycobacterium yunnanensis TaxID=368477 RepID=UPI0021F25424|nr:hypothetical protein [Mycobacterium yunnanensis]